MKIFKILIIFLLILANVYSAYSYAEDRHEITLSPPSKFMAGETKTVQATIVNNNKRCDYSSCEWHAEGRSGSTGFISHGGGTGTVSFQVTAPTGAPGYFGISISAVCYIPKSIYCWWDDELTDSITAYYTYCGDGSCDSSESCSACSSDCGVCCGNGRIDPGENCDGTNKKSCKELGYDYGSTICSSCRLVTSNCGRCNHECSIGQKECAGDGYKTCETDFNECRKWSSIKRCSSDEICSNGNCINVNNDLNCGAIGYKCALDEKTSSSGKKYCSPDYTKAIEVLGVTTEKCINKQCVAQSVNKNREVDCRAKNTYCQDGTCGCSEGYEVCEPLKRCVKKKDVKLNQPCSCDFQCEKGFCDSVSKQCVGGLNVQLSAEKSTLSVGEETTVSLSVSNPLKNNVDADILLNLGSGVELVEVLSGDQCSGSQCKLDMTNIPANGKKEVTVKVQAKSDVNSLMSATVTYELAGRNEPIEISEKNTIKIIECGNGKLDEGETSETCCIDAGCPKDDQFYTFKCNKRTQSCSKMLHSYYIYAGIGVLVLVALIIFGISKVVKHKKSSPKKEKKEKEKEQQKIKESKRESKKEEKICERCGKKMGLIHICKGKKEEAKPTGEIAKQIGHLHSLMEKGILTEREFKKKKKKLLKMV